MTAKYRTTEQGAAPMQPPMHHQCITKTPPNAASMNHYHRCTITACSCLTSCLPETARTARLFISKHTWTLSTRKTKSKKKTKTKKQVQIKKKQQHYYYKLRGRRGEGKRATLPKQAKPNRPSRSEREKKAGYTESATCGAPVAAESWLPCMRPPWTR